jgi:hypothetical protein
MAHLFACNKYRHSRMIAIELAFIRALRVKLIKSTLDHLIFIIFKMSEILYLLLIMFMLFSVGLNLQVLFSYISLKYVKLLRVDLVRIFTKLFLYNVVLKVFNGIHFFKSHMAVLYGIIRI